MLTISDKSLCSGCHACVNVCSQHCIAMINDKEGFLYPQIDQERCINCGICEKTCPIKNRTTITKDEDKVKAYAAYSTNADIRLSSSSGGVFTEIAVYVLNNQGVVFGASFDKDFCVKHIHIESIIDLPKLRTAKYVQSVIGNAYSEVKKFLDTGRMVLFTGTPCQIGGLYAYLGGDHEKLITQDLICHGVPSPSVWHKYLEEVKQENKLERIEHINFRAKPEGWKRYHVTICGKNTNGEPVVLSELAGYNRFMKIFLLDLCLRPSCYNCSFKQMIRQSDIMLADFWGIEKVMPQLRDNRGISLVLVFSVKGQRVFDEIKKNLVSYPVSLQDGLAENSSWTTSVKQNVLRKTFMNTFEKISFDAFFSKYYGPSTISKVRRRARILINKLTSDIAR